jgi:hypothetical protein
MPSFRSTKGVYRYRYQSTITEQEINFGSQGTILFVQAKRAPISAYRHRLTRFRTGELAEAGVSTPRVAASS